MGVIISKPPKTYTAGEGIDISAGNVVSGENATTANKGIASFNTNDFSVVGGAVSLKNKQSFWTCAGSAFSSTLPDIQSVAKSLGRFQALQNSVAATVSVNLPNGATITEAAVLGNATAQAETWYLRRINLSTAAVDTLATTGIGAGDPSVANPVVNNGVYGYFIETSSLDTNDTIYAARVIYTTDYV